jgi:nucleoside-diphosphate-sugar epimerase
MIIANEEQLEDVLSRPGDADVQAMASLEGDLLILGVAGKMGPSLARRARRACDAAGVKRRNIGVARFSNPAMERELNDWGIETVAADLLQPGALDRLPDAPNVIFMAARKFGSTGAESLTWAMNTFLPGLVAQRYRDSRIVSFSTGNVYPLTPVLHGGPSETSPTGPVGEYAQSCLGRERMFQHFSTQYGTPVSIVRLNYAVELRYGVLVDIARKVCAGRPVDLRMGHANVIWQGDANSVVLRSLGHCQSPPFIVNLTGPETVAVRWVARKFGEYFGVEPVLEGAESETALLSNAGLCQKLFGYPSVPLEQMIEWIAGWVRSGGSNLNKPTHFETRDGKF